MTKPCRSCSHQVSLDAPICPNCGAPYPARDKLDGFGYEYKSEATFLGLPLVHISFKYRLNRTPVVAKGFLAIGQFACGFITISQFGVGVFCLSQIAIAGFAMAQIAAAYALIAQCGLYIHYGYGQMVKGIFELLR